VSQSIVPSEAQPLESVNPGPLDALARRILHGMLKRLRYGKLNIIEEGVPVSYGRRVDSFPLEATINVNHPRCFGCLLFGGSVGAGEAYMAGYWSADDLTKVIRILTRNQDLLQDMEGRFTIVSTPLNRLLHSLHRNTMKGSLRNIHAHYDLGNDFYSLFLDETMTYSCNVFESPESTLEEAASSKYERICRKLRLGPEHRLIEIGTGWGGFAIHAASRYGCHVTTTTISREQHSLAQSKVAEHGLEDRVDLLYKDYRDLTGTYDKLVSIEMIEAVGYERFDQFFRKCGSLLKEDGQLALQAIVIADRYFERAKRSVDFIRKYIFPGGCLPSVAAICSSTSRVTDLQLVHMEDITPHYATTLRIWRERFTDKLERVRSLGYSDTFIRMWEYYLCLCEAAFAERHIGDVQMIFSRPAARCDSILGGLD
jgi:cyclopropane-fatty-acyl-phospholipid synthase